jgi:hypothetical protein
MGRVHLIELSMDEIIIFKLISKKQCEDDGLIYPIRDRENVNEYSVS